MDEKVLYADDIKGYAGAVNKGDWVINVAEYGLDCVISDMPATYLVGDEVEIPVALGGEATQAVLTIYDETLFGADYRAVNETGVLKAKCKKEGVGQLAVMYLDKDCKWLDSTAFTFTVK